MQLRRQLHHTLIGVLPAARDPILQKSFQLHDLMLRPFSLPLYDRLATQLGGRFVTQSLSQHGDENCLVLRGNLARDHKPKRCVQRCRSMGIAHVFLQTEANVLRFVECARPARV